MDLSARQRKELCEQVEATRTLDRFFAAVEQPQQGSNEQQEGGAGEQAYEPVALAGPLRSGDGQEQAELEAAILASLVQEEAAQSEGNEQAGMEAADGEQSEGNEPAEMEAADGEQVSEPEREASRQHLVWEVIEQYRKWKRAKRSAKGKPRGCRRGRDAEVRGPSWTTSFCRLIG